MCSSYAVAQPTMEKTSISRSTCKPLRFTPNIRLPVALNWTSTNCPWKREGRGRRARVSRPRLRADVGIALLAEGEGWECQGKGGEEELDGMRWCGGGRPGKKSAGSESREQASWPHL
eukprot:COSAG02_NODE_17421_length_1005_cov_0.769316_1_plen_118_part_00